MKRELLKLAAVLVLLLVGLGLGGCGESRSPFAGTYRSEETFAGNKYVDLDLKEDGKGTWALAGKTVEFTWRGERRQGLDVPQDRGHRDRHPQRRGPEIVAGHDRRLASRLSPQCLCDL